MARSDFPKVEALKGNFRERIIKSFPQNALENTFGSKFWCSSAGLIEAGAVRAFVGINPAGGQDAAAHDRDQGYPEKPYGWPRLECFFGRDVAWMEPVSRKCSTAFQGNVWCRRRRENPPPYCLLQRVSLSDYFRFPENLSPDLWAVSAEWCIEVLKHIQPKLDLIICMGNRELRSKSALGHPWPSRHPDPVGCVRCLLRRGSYRRGRSGQLVGFFSQRRSVENWPSERCSSLGNTTTCFR